MRVVRWKSYGHREVFVFGRAVGWGDLPIDVIRFRAGWRGFIDYNGGPFFRRRVDAKRWVECQIVKRGLP